MTATAPVPNGGGGPGRVPAALNGLVGLKPTRGRWSTRGVVPACRSLDCVTILTRTVMEATRVFEVACGFDPSDPYSRVPGPGQGAAPWAAGGFRFGVPADGQLQFFGDDEAAVLYRRAVADLQSLGGTKVEIDYALFRAAADLLYSGPWVAERLAAIGPFLETHGADMNAVVRDIIAGARRFTAVDAFQAEYRLRELRRATEAEWARMDVLVVPTTGTIYTHEAVAADPLRLNTNLGYYTNFVNLLDLAAVAVPAGFDQRGLPFGITLIGPGWTDYELLSLAARFESGTAASADSGSAAPAGGITLAVCGAHMDGLPLNGELRQLGATFVERTRTAASYRLYALPGGPPQRPGLVRVASDGAAIEVELWSVPESRLGSFIAQIPAPLAIGKVQLADGGQASGFLCEACAVQDAVDITALGGWRAWLARTGL